MRVCLGAAVACVLVAACGNPEIDAGPAVFEQKEHDVVYADVEFPFEVVTKYRTEDALPDLRVTALAIYAGKVVVGTPSGVFVHDEAQDRFVELSPMLTEPVTALAAVSDTTLAVGTNGGIALYDPGAAMVSRASLPTSTVTAVANAGGAVFAASEDGVWAYLLGVAQLFVPTPATSLAVHSGTLFVGTSTGVELYDVDNGTRIAGAEGDNVSGRPVRALIPYGPSVVAAFEDAIVIFDKKAESQVIPVGREGLPTGDVRTLASGPNALFVGHGTGATALTGAKIDHYVSERWIMDDEVTAVVVASDGARWIGTRSGLSRISFETTTLKEKADLLEAGIDPHWRMDGFVDDRIGFDDAYELKNVIHSDKDNDGLWTEMQIGTWCYAYAATGDESFYDKARRAMDVMFLQFDIPAKTFQANGRKPGFITRSLVRDDEGEIFENKKTQDNWHEEEWEGRTYFWKDDTSSDEYAGHYFGIPIFYDLCAKNEAEREEIRTRLRSSTDYLIENDYRLIDLDGEPTTHGHWHDLAVAVDGIDGCPEKYNLADCLSSFGGGGWLNSIEILGHLLAAWHVTGDQKYLDEYERLATQERYLEMVPVKESTLTVTDPAIANHSDHELAMLGYITLIRYEPHEERREMIIRSLLDFYEYEREEHNPWQVATIATIYSGDVDTDGAVQTLKDLPTDMRDWGLDNGHRKDAGRWPDDRHGNAQFDRVFPYDEIRTMKWNGNPYAVSNGGNGRSVLSPTPYLISYWMLRYYGVIIE